METQQRSADKRWLKGIGISDTTEFPKEWQIVSLRVRSRSVWQGSMRRINKYPLGPWSMIQTRLDPTASIRETL